MHVKLGTASGRTRGRILITLFFAAIILATFLLSRFLAPRLEHLRRTSGDDIPQWTVEEILAGDVIRVRHKDTSKLVHVCGVACPPPEPTAGFRQAQERLGLPDHALLERARIARNTLSAWIFRKQAQVLTQRAAAEGPEDAYVRVSGIDVGRTMLEGGQAYVLDVTHPLLDDYRELEARARTEGIGIWRAP